MIPFLQKGLTMFNFWPRRRYGARLPAHNDTDALRADWDRVGADLTDAIHAFDEAHPEVAARVRDELARERSARRRHD